MSLILSILIDLMKGFSVGLMLFFLVPALTRPLDWTQKQGIINGYVSMAMSTLGRGVMVIRANGGQKLKQTTYDTTNGGERTQLGGETKHWRNPHHMMKTLAGRPFGIAHENKDVLYDIRTAHIAELFRDYKERGVWKVGGYRKAYANIAEGTQLVDVRPVVDTIQSSASPGLADRIETFVEKMESLFDQHNMFEFLPWLIGLGAGVGLMFMISKAMNSAAGGSVLT